VVLIPDINKNLLTGIIVFVILIVLLAVAIKLPSPEEDSSSEKSKGILGFLKKQVENIVDVFDGDDEAGEEMAFTGGGIKGEYFWEKESY